MKAEMIVMSGKHTAPLEGSRANAVNEYTLACRPDRPWDDKMRAISTITVVTNEQYAIGQTVTVTIEAAE